MAKVPMTVAAQNQTVEALNLILGLCAAAAAALRAV